MVNLKKEENGIKKMTSTPVDLPQEFFRINRDIWYALTIKVGASFLIFSAKIPSKCPLKLAISEGIFHFCEKNLQKGVGKYTFKSFIGRGTKLFHNISKSCPLLALPIQSK